MLEEKEACDICLYFMNQEYLDEATTEVEEVTFDEVSFDEASLKKEVFPEEKASLEAEATTDEEEASLEEDVSRKSFFR